jgi:hypothetical protein
VLQIFKDVLIWNQMCENKGQKLGFLHLPKMKGDVLTASVQTQQGRKALKLDGTTLTFMGKTYDDVKEFGDILEVIESAC